MHEEPGRRWTLPKLAKESACSRAVLARRFMSELGVPPLRHLTRWRLELAARSLVETDDGLASIAARVG